MIEPHQLRERLLAFLRQGAERERHSFGTFDTRRLVAADGAGIEVSVARRHDGKFRLYVVRSPAGGVPRLVVRLAWGDEPLTVEGEAGPWLDELPGAENNPTAKGGQKSWTAR
jgi:hypothetical protein